MPLRNFVLNYKVHEMKTLFDIGIMDEVQTCDLLSPHYDNVIRSMSRGWNDYYQITNRSPDECLAFTATTRANIVHNNITKHAHRLFSNVKGIICYAEDKIFTIDFYGKIRLRFKKLDHSLKPSNVPTVQQMEFASQTLFGAVTNITAGYRLDRTEAFIEDMHLVCWYNDSLFWNILLPYKEAIKTDTNLDDVIQDSTKIIIHKTQKAETA